MTDDITTTYRHLVDLANRLADAARIDRDGALMPGAGLSGRVTGTPMTEVDPDDPDAGSVAMSPTERGVTQLATATTYQRVLDSFGRVLEVLGPVARDVLPHAPRSCQTAPVDEDTGATTSCEGTATHGPWCADCAEFLGRNGYGPPARLVDHWNRKRQGWCQCPPECCERDDDGHTSCRDRVDPGEGRMSPRCRKRMQRLRDLAKASSADPGSPGRR